MQTQIKNIIAVAACKGGVGKSMLTVNLALACRELGLKVGIVDADLHGPSIPRMITEESPPKKQGEFIVPAKGFGISYISLSHLHQGAALMRAPIARNWLEIFSKSVLWGDLDLLLIDFPPGTGDIPLTLAQEMKLTGALLITTPQLIAVQDVSKCAQMFRAMNTPLLGVVENMSYLADAPSQKPFGEGGGEQLASAYKIDLLAKIPLDSKIAQSADRGISLFSQGAGQNFFALAELFLQKVEGSSPLVLKEYAQNEKGVFVHFSDGKSGVIALKKLQKSCPCVRCREARVTASPLRVDASVRLRELQPVGSYAFRCYFTSGCSQGIYPHRLLRELI
ncbi:MAG: P-loop NTPase [Candidatus Algichlamydia australiensis]|nr:P-loop NTPase [Chlamydiales bacterium]